MLTSDWPQPRATLADTPVFLPVKSPTVPFRLVVYELVEDVQVIDPCAEFERKIKYSSCYLRNKVNPLIRDIFDDYANQYIQIHCPHDSVMMSDVYLCLLARYN